MQEVTRIRFDSAQQEELNGVSLETNLRSKMRIDALARRIAATIREAPGERKLNQDATRQLLEMTDYKHHRIRGLHLYVKPSQGDLQEVVVLDNELPIYRSTVADVTMRRAPRWKEMVSIRNIRKVLNDEDILVCRGKASLARIRERAAAQLDLSYGREDLESLVKDAARAVAACSAEQLQDSLQLFFELLPFEMLSLEALPYNVQAFAEPESHGESVELYINLLLFDPEQLQVRLLKGRFSPRSDLDLARLLQCVAGERPADLEGTEVFSFLAELAMHSPSAKDR